MSHVDVILPSKDEEENPKLYIANKLVPMVSRLYNICNDLIVPGTGDQEFNDMTTPGTFKDWKNVNTRMNALETKSFAFELDKSLPFAKDGKRLFALLTATCYVTEGTAAFRVLRSRDSIPLKDSEIRCLETEPKEFSKILHIKNVDGHISQNREMYHMQARMVHGTGQPVCRRFRIETFYQ